MAGNDLLRLINCGTLINLFRKLFDWFIKMCKVSEIHNSAPLCYQLDNVYLKAWVFIFGNPIQFFRKRLYYWSKCATAIANTTTSSFVSYSLEYYLNQI